MNKFYALVRARTMEFVRDRGTFFWNLLFPVLLVVGFSFAFSGEGDALFKIGVMGTSETEMPEFLEMDAVDTVFYQEDLEEVLNKLRRHQIDMIVDPGNSTYYLNSESPSAEVLRSLSRSDMASFTEESVSGEAVRYVDWLVPGVIGMNIMFSCMFGVGFVIVRYRKNGVLKRMKATPVGPLLFISAQMVSRFVIVLCTSVFVFAGTGLFLRFRVHGSLLLLLFLTIVAILCMIAFGLIFAARLKSEELANGLMNLVTFPMMIFSGVFFSLEGTPPVIQSLSRVFPLTHFIEGARSVMIDGAGFAAVLPNIAVMGGMTVLFLMTAAFLFRWE